jgi:hypothetical protein
MRTESNNRPTSVTSLPNTEKITSNSVQENAISSTSVNNHNKLAVTGNSASNETNPTAKNALIIGNTTGERNTTSTTTIINATLLSRLPAP